MQRSRVRRFLALTATAAFAVSGTVAATTSGWSSDAEFAAGTLASTEVGGGAITLQLDGVGAPDPAIAWWDDAWGQRQCVAVTNNEATALTEYQVVVDLDTATPIAGGRMNAAGDDIRAIASDGTTLLDYWIEGPIDAATTRIWVQSDTLPPGASTICLYSDNPAAAAASDPLTPFTYDTPRPLYVAVSATHAGRAVSVASYVDDNDVSDGTTSVTLAAGGTSLLPGATHTPATVITATGPLALRATGSAADTYVPIAFAGTDFVVPTSRSLNRVSLHAPFGTADVTIEHSGTTTNVNVPAGTTVTTDADITATADAAVITATAPVLVTHTASGTTDTYAAVPVTDERLFGIRSTQHLTGFGQDATTVQITESDGNSLVIAGDEGDQVPRGSGGSQGTGPAVIADPTAGGSIAANQQADSDGGESSAYWPESELNVLYRVATQSQYVALACPEQGTSNIDAAGTTLDCTGTGGAGFPGKARVAPLAAGALVQSLDGNPFHLYAEDQASNDEANVLGPKQARLNTTNPPTVVVGPEQSRYVPAGTWASEVIDTGCSSFFDLVRWNPAAQPADTTLSMQIASSVDPGGPFVPVGPDGTAATSYDSAGGAALAAIHEGDRYFQVVATLTTADRLATPRLDDLAVEWEGSASVSGTAFADGDADGTFGGADAGLGAVPVELWLDDGDDTFDAATDTLQATAATAADGTYSFDAQRPGTYFVVADESALDTAHLISATTGNPPAAITVGECSAGVADIGWEFGARLEATVFSDADADGAFDAGEPGTDGVPVALWLDDGDGLFDRLSDTAVVTVETDATGVADFGLVAAGDYFVFVSPGDEPAGHALPATTPNPGGPLTVADGDDATAAIGFVPAASVSGTVIGDVAGQPPLAGVFVSLYEDDGDGVFDPAADRLVTSTLSASDGAFAMRSVAAGVYWLVPGPAPSGYLASAPIAVTVDAGAAVERDVVFSPAAEIRGSVIADDDGVPDDSTMFIGGTTVVLFLDDGDGVFEPGTDIEVGRTVSNGDGEFTFDSVAPGQYFVQADLGSGVIGEATQIRSANPVGPVAAGTTDVLFVADPIVLTLPETGGDTAVLVRLAALVLALGALLVGLGSRGVGRWRTWRRFSG